MDNLITRLVTIARLDNKRFMATGLALAVLLQVSVLSVEYLSSVWPRWFGTPVTLMTQPIDPRSLFRGNYVRLGYEISRIRADSAAGDLRAGEVGYVTLKQAGDVYVAAGLQREQPQEGLFIRGRVRSSGGVSYQMHYGIEAYFLPKERALAAEDFVREGALAKVYVLGNGKAAIANLMCGGSPC